MHAIVFSMNADELEAMVGPSALQMPTKSSRSWLRTLLGACVGSGTCRGLHRRFFCVSFSKVVNSDFFHVRHTPRDLATIQHTSSCTQTCILGASISSGSFLFFVVVVLVLVHVRSGALFTTLSTLGMLEKDIAELVRTFAGNAARATPRRTAVQDPGRAVGQLIAEVKKTDTYRLLKDKIATALKFSNHGSVLGRVPDVRAVPLVPRVGQTL